MPSIDDSNPSDVKAPETLEVVEQPEVACLGDSAKNDDRPEPCLEAGASKGLSDSEKVVESVIAASVCSRTSMKRALDDTTIVRKRKCHDIEDSEWHSDVSTKLYTRVLLCVPRSLSESINEKNSSSAGCRRRKQ